MKLREKPDSRHFAQMWKHVIKARNAALAECDKQFYDICGLRICADDKLKTTLEQVYRNLRTELKRECYFNEAEKKMLDGRKMGAIMCNALMKEKVFYFDEQQALVLLREKKKEYGEDVYKKVELNKWIANNFFINYKAAYLFSVGLVVETMKERLFRENPDLGSALNKKGWMEQYPEEKEIDSFNVSMVLGLGKADLKGEKLDMFMYALQLYQIEQYTLLALRAAAQRAEKTPV